MTRSRAGLLKCLFTTNPNGVSQRPVIKRRARASLHPCPSVRLGFSGLYARRSRHSWCLFTPQACATQRIGRARASYTRLGFDTVALAWSGELTYWTNAYTPRVLQVSRSGRPSIRMAVNQARLIGSNALNLSMTSGSTSPAGFLSCRRLQ